MGKYRRLIGFSLAISMLFGALAYAAPVQTHWIAAVDGYYITASNWTAGEPGANDTAVFDPAGTTAYTVDISGGPVVLPPPQYTVKQAYIGSAVTLAQAPVISLPRTPSFVASDGIFVDDGQLTTKIPVSTGFLGVQESPNGFKFSISTLDVDGAPFTVTDNNPYALEVGRTDLGPGMLTIQNGGTLELTQSGASAAVATGNGGTVAGPSEIDVDGSSSKLALDGTGPLIIGDIGAGILKVTNGGHVDDNIGLLGPNSSLSGSTGGYGQVTIDGATSLWTNRDHLNIGVPTADTPSSLTLANGGTVTVTNQLLVTTQGRITGNGSITAGSVINEAMIAPGSDVAGLHLAGVLHLNTSFLQANSGALQVQLAGTTAGTQYDQILISGTSVLTGNLNVELADNFVPKAGNFFHILDLGTVTGAFATVNLPTLANGLTWDTSQLYSAGIIAVVGTAVPGDYNRDGVVDAADYTVWRDHLGQSVTLPNDTTPGTVTQADYDFWKSHYGNHAGSGAGATVAKSVPEPSALVLAAIGAIAVARFSRSRA
jgi:T5SS/PEP-CTERM-associated repeat protein